MLHGFNYFLIDFFKHLIFSCFWLILATNKTKLLTSFFLNNNIRVYIPSNTFYGWNVYIWRIFRQFHIFRICLVQKSIALVKSNASTPQKVENVKCYLLLHYRSSCCCGCQACLHCVNIQNMVKIWIQLNLESKIYINLQSKRITIAISNKHLFKSTHIKQHLSTLSLFVRSEINKNIKLMLFRTMN